MDQISNVQEEPLKDSHFIDVNCTISVRILDAHEIRHEGYKVRCTKVTHKKIHQKFDGIDLEGYVYHLSNPGPIPQG